MNLNFLNFIELFLLIFTQFSLNTLLSHCICKCKLHNVSERKIAYESPDSRVRNQNLPFVRDPCSSSSFPPPRIPLLFFFTLVNQRQERFRFNHIGLFIPRATFVLMDISIFPSPPLPLLSLLSPFNYVRPPRSFPESSTFQLEAVHSRHTE